MGAFSLFGDELAGDISTKEGDHMARIELLNASTVGAAGISIRSVLRGVRSVPQLRTGIRGALHVAATAANFKLILAELKKHNPKMPVIVCQVFPSSASKSRPADKIKKINELYQAELKTQPQATLLDTWTLFANEQGDAKAVKTLLDAGADANETQNGTKLTPMPSAMACLRPTSA